MIPDTATLGAAVGVVRTWWELWAVVAAGLAAATVAPAVISRTRRSSPLDPAAAEAVAAAGVPPERVVVLDAGDGVAAFAAGLAPRFGRVFVTERLVRDLPPAEVAAVTCHEYAHLARRHVPLRLAVPVGFALAWITAASSTPGSGFVVGLALLVPTVLSSLWVNRWSEFDADAYAAGRLGGASLANALRRLAAAGHVTDGGRLSLHPTLADRIDRLGGDERFGE